jgi:hypothetical protein
MDYSSAIRSSAGGFGHFPGASRRQSDRQAHADRREWDQALDFMVHDRGFPFTP